MENQVCFTVNVPRAVLELHLFCSKDVMRENISRIYFGRFKQVATNGHCLAYTDFDFSGEQWETPHKKINEIFIPADVAKAALQGNTPKDFYFYQLEYGTKQVSLVTRSGGPDGPAVSSQIIDAYTTQAIAYPDFGQVIPKEFKPLARIGLDLGYLDLFKRFLRRVDLSLAAEFRFTDDLGPALATRTLDDGKTEVGFVIMPIRLTD